MTASSRLLTRVRGLIGAAVLAGVLSACSRANTPVAGDYRAVLQIKGGEVPLLLTVTPAQHAATPGITLKVGTQTLSASRVEIKEGHLSAQWPQLGTLNAGFDGNSLSGELHMTASSGTILTLPLVATLNQPWRFVKDASTDNADISGLWRVSGEATPMRLQLTQRHDQVDGVLMWPDGRAAGISGQTHGDTVYLGSIGNGQVLLFKGMVNTQGALQGQAWINQGNPQPWVIARDAPTPAIESAASRQLGLPWAVPVREMAPVDQHMN